MFFLKKKKLHNQYNHKLLQLLNGLKEVWMENKRIVSQSIEPSDELLFELKISEAKYFYMIKEAKVRKVSLTNKK